MIFALFNCVESLLDFFIGWLPLYYELKLAFILWLMCPPFWGAKYLYLAYIEPFLATHQPDIDSGLETLAERAGNFQLHDLRKLGSLAATKGQEAVALYQHARSEGAPNPGGTEKPAAPEKKHI